MDPGVLALVAKINKQYGENTLMLAADVPTPPRFPSGSLSLDIALGGGWPGNQWSEVIGQESSGKTAVVLKTIAANQAANPEFTCWWVAAEGYDPDWARALGVDNTRVLVHLTNSMEHAYTAMLEASVSRMVDAVVLDSYPALIADTEAEKGMDELVIATGARLTGKFFRKAGAATARSMAGTERPMLGLIINQWRDKIGGFSPQGTPRTSPGGNAKNYAFYTRLEVSRAEYIDEARPGKGSARVGQVVKLRTIKNKSAAPHKIATVDFYFDDAPYLGFHQGDYDEVKELILMGLLTEAIERAGAYYTAAGTRVKGKDALLDLLRGDLTAQDQLRADILARAFPQESL
jgi:recombination protein RecA